MCLSLFVSALCVSTHLYCTRAYGLVQQELNNGILSSLVPKCATYFTHPILGINVIEITLQSAVWVERKQRDLRVNHLSFHEFESTRLIEQIKLIIALHCMH